MVLSVTSFSLLAPLLLMFLGIGQVAFWRRWRQYRELLCLGCAFIAISVAVAIQVLWRPASLPLYVLAFSIFYLAGFACVGLALARRMVVHYPWAAAWLICATSVGLQIWFSAVEPDLPVRVFIVNAASMALSGLPLWHWRRMHTRNRFDVYLRWLYVIFIVLNSLRLVVTLPLSKVEQVFQFTHTWFWLSMHVFLMALGLMVAACMFGALLHDVLEQLKIDRNTDALTSLPNRRGWAQSLEQLKQQPAARHAVLLVDVDHFKHINDRFGHATGDRVLQAVAHTMRQLVRSQDMVCRYGGEEFVLLLTNTSAEGAAQVAERIRQQVQRIDLLQHHGVTVTVSIGVTLFNGIAEHHIAQAISAADQQMYAAKSAGRNQVSTISLAA